MSNLARRISALSPEQRALLEKKLRRQTPNSTRAQTIPRRSLDGPCPLSFDQEQLWYMDQRHPGSNAFNLSTSYLITGPVSVETLELAFGEMMRRHEVLRTTFPTRNGLPYQQIADEGEMELRKADLRGLPAAEREAELERLWRRPGATLSTSRAGRSSARSSCGWTKKSTGSASRSTTSSWIVGHSACSGAN